VVTRFFSVAQVRDLLLIQDVADILEGVAYFRPKDPTPLRQASSSYSILACTELETDTACLVDSEVTEDVGFGQPDLLRPDYTVSCRLFN